MQKIPTMFVRDESKPSHPVTDVIKPECQWVLEGEGIATRKWDGTNVKIEAGRLFKRQKPKGRDYDEASYVPCSVTDPADKWAFEAFTSQPDWPDGIYELIGPKVQGNPHRFTAHTLISVWPETDAVSVIDTDFPRTFDGIRAVLEATVFEGIVFHHEDGRLAKIKRRDFGFAWPIK